MVKNKRNLKLKKIGKWMGACLLLLLVPFASVVTIVLSCTYNKTENNIALLPPQSNNEETINLANTLSLESSIGFKSSNELFNSLNGYKNMKNKIIDEVQKSNFDFTSSTNWEENANKFFDIVKDYGIVGNIGDSPEQRLELSPRIDEKNLQKYTTKRMLDKFSSSDSLLAKDWTDKINLEKFNDIIKNNPFGFLPSNFSEFLYLIKLDDLASLFKIPGSIKQIFANFDDDKGEIEILIINNNLEKFIFNLDVDKLTNLKKNNDFYQYIYDRSFRISFPVYVYKDEASPFSSTRDYRFKKTTQIGSAWIVDRIVNKDRYEFLIATNVHVLSLSMTYNKYFFQSPNSVSEPFEKYWNAGFWSNEYKDKIIDNNINGSKYQELKKVDRDKPIPVKIGKTNNELVDDANKNQRTEDLVDSLSSENYIDSILYTPFFDSKAVRTLQRDDGLIFDDKLLGLIKNSGMDFALSKISLTNEQIKNFFPTLYKVLDTDKEKDWYIGLNSNLISPSQTIFSSGYNNLFDWTNAKFDSGRIYVKNRQIDQYNNYDILRYWTRYDEKINDERNKKQAYYYKKKMREDLEHGMDLWFANNQASFYLGKPNNLLKPGCSGSLAINSRFEPVGVLNSVVFDGDNIDDATNFANAIVLFNSITKNADTSWKGNVATDVKSFLELNKIKTFSINN